MTLLFSIFGNLQSLVFSEEMQMFLESVFHICIPNPFRHPWCASYGFSFPFGSCCKKMERLFGTSNEAMKLKVDKLVNFPAAVKDLQLYSLFVEKGIFIA